MTDRHLANDNGPGWRVSTSRGGLGKEPEGLETMLFGSPWDCIYQGHDSEEKALSRHALAVRHVRRAWFRRFVLRVAEAMTRWATRRPAWFTEGETWRSDRGL